jgi:circadian clock protein KaiC
VVERVKPDRVVLDSLSEIRLLAQSSLRYRRQILAIKHYFAKFGTTVMLLDDLTAELADKTVHSVAPSCRPANLHIASADASTKITSRPS